MQKFMLLGLLGFFSLEDIKCKKLTVIYILMFGISGVLLHLVSPICSIYSILCGMFLGIVLLLIGFVTRGGVGLGDGILLVVTGVYLGGYGNLELFMGGIFLASLWSLGMLIFKQKNRKDEIAFVPFLLFSYLTMLIRGA